MNEQKILRKQFFKYIKSNIMMFIVIFVVFGIFVYGLVSRITYNSVNLELRENVKLLKNVLKEFDTVEIGNKLFFNNEKSEIFRNYNIISSITNPKIICIIRNEDGVIVNSSLSSNSEEYIIDLEFDEDIIDEVYEVIIDDEYYYRGITIDLNGVLDGQGGYVQLLANIDTEKELTVIYQKIVVISVIFGCIISIIASVIMAKRTLDPIYEMLRRQNEFVQNVSHELRTPLTIIQAKQEILLSEPNAKIIDKTEEISLTLNETKRMSKLTKDLMLLARADNKQMVIQKEEVEIDEFISNIVKGYTEIIELEGKTIDLDLKYNKLVSIDTNKFYQVMVILLDNAMKYTENGDKITITSMLKDNKCVIEVKDTGIGIGDDAIKHIFERFYREDTARSRETGGSGLGLSIADTIIAAHGGTIRASHNGDKGTIFTIRLPR